MNGIQAFRVVSVGFFGLAAILPPIPSAGAGLVGLVLLALTLSSSAVRTSSAPVWIRGLIVVVVLITGLLGLSRGNISYPSPAGIAPVLFSLGVAVAAVLLAMRRRSFDRLAAWIAAAVVVVLAVGVMVEFAGNLVGLDVYLSHEAAADALAEGANPYTDAVRVIDGSPNAEPGAVIEGYSYPPVTLLSFATADWVAGDPRWVTVAAMVATLAVIGVTARHERIGLGVAAGVALLAAMPLNRAMVWSGWTEPVTVFLLALALLLWPRAWASGLVLGLALATKQYMVVLVPLLILAEGRPWKRSGTAGVVAVATLLPAALVDFDSFWFTMVERPLSLGFRPDTQSLSGAAAALGWPVNVPAWAMGIVVVAIAMVVGRRARDRADVAAGAALVLGATFLLSLAFVNYWWLVQWVAMLSVAFGARDTPVPPEDEGVIRNAVAP